MDEQLTSLQQALIGVGLVEFPFEINGKPYPRKVEDLTDVQLKAVCRYGKRICNDAWNTSKEKKDAKGSAAFMERWLPNLGLTTGKGGGGGSKLTYTERATREILEALFVGKDFKEKAATAKEMARNKDRWITVARRYIIRDLQAAGYSVDELEGIDLQAFAEENADVYRDGRAEEINKRAMKLQALDEENAQVTEPTADASKFKGLPPKKAKE